MTEATRQRRFVQLDLPVETIERVDSLAEVETISRTAWIRRLVISATRGAKDAVPA